jgi:hypothetical protein
MQLTQQAWQLNGKLAAQTDASAARAIVGQMVALYQQARGLAVPGPGTRILKWVAANKAACIAGGATAVGGVLLLVAIAPRRRAA